MHGTCQLYVASMSRKRGPRAPARKPRLRVVIPADEASYEALREELRLRQLFEMDAPTPPFIDFVKKRSSTAIQRQWRQWFASRSRAATLIQSWFRGWSCRMRTSMDPNHPVGRLVLMRRIATDMRTDALCWSE